MKKILNEQLSQQKVDLKQARDVYKCGFLQGTQYGTFRGVPMMRKVAEKDGELEDTFLTGDVLFIKDNYRYDVIRNNKLVKSDLVWACDTLYQDVKLPKITPQQMKSVDDFIAKYPGMYTKETPTADQLKTKEWTPINLKDRFPDMFKFDFTIYQKGGLRQAKSPQQENIIRTYLGQGYKDIGGKLNPAQMELYDTIDLKDEYPDDFPQSYILVVPIDSLDMGTLIERMTSFVLMRNFGDRKTCKEGIGTYFSLFMKSKKEKIPVDNAKLNNWKRSIKACEAKVNFGAGPTKNRLKKMNEDETRLGFKKKETTPYDTFTTSDVTNESYLNLKKIVRESLLEAKNQKKKEILAENEIIHNRFNLIVENIDISSKKGEEKFYNDLITEIFYLNNQGFDSQIINEQFWDLIKGLFGHGGDAITETFKEYFIKWVLNQIGVDKNSWISDAIAVTFGNLELSDITKLTDCTFVTKLISKSISETAIKRLQNSAGMEGKFYDLLRNSLVATLEESDLGQKIETALGSMLCPLLGNIKQKMDVTASTMKEKALS